MGRRQEAVSYLRRGYTPNRIATEMGVTVGTILGYLYHQVGEGVIQRSDILFSFGRDLHEAIENMLTDGRSAKRSAVQRRLAKKGMRVEPEDLYLYLKLRNARVDHGDLYESIRMIEIHLHNLAKRVLTEKFAEAWWRQIPLEVRRKCADRFECENPPAAEPYCYTEFIDLKKIYDDLWGCLSIHLPEEFERRKKQFLSELGYINQVRNAVMHPVKGLKLNEESFRRVRTFQKTLEGKEQLPVDTWQSILEPVPSGKIQ